ncbi:hypothetical protein [Labrys miyagiensis]
MSEDEKVRENRIRRAAERQGMQLQKSRRRDPRAIDFGGYMLVDASSNTLILGGSPYAYSASLDEVETYLFDRK